MSTFKLEFETYNSAFECGNRDYEIARILREIAERAERGLSPNDVMLVKDYNGNHIGIFKLSE